MVGDGSDVVMPAPLSGHNVKEGGIAVTLLCPLCPGSLPPIKVQLRLCLVILDHQPPLHYRVLLGQMQCLKTQNLILHPVNLMLWGQLQVTPSLGCPSQALVLLIPVHVRFFLPLFLAFIGELFPVQPPILYSEQLLSGQFMPRPQEYRDVIVV
jgi:hypothetical protein